jgi:hypothetical protein
MVNRDWTAKLTGLIGAAPPALLRARPIEDAHDVLVCSYTSDLRFFETTCLPEVRAMRAKVTMVRDAAHGIPATEPQHTGAYYTDVPVRCRSGGEFHPKLVVIAGQGRAVAGDRIRKRHLRRMAP